MTDKRDEGPSEQERANPGSTEVDPANKSSQQPAEGGDDNPPGQPGSPRG